MPIETMSPEKRELTITELERLLEVKVSQSTTWATVKRYIESGTPIRFIVTKSFDIYLGTSDHDGIKEDNGIEENDVAINNGAIWEDEDGRGLNFFLSNVIYYSFTRCGREENNRISQTQRNTNS